MKGVLLGARSLFAVALTVGAGVVVGSEVATASPEAEGGDDSVPTKVTHEYEYALLSVTRTNLQGRPTGDGGCEFAFPVLELRQDQREVMARPVSTDFTTCTTIVEIGEPPAGYQNVDTPADGTGSSGIAERVGTMGETIGDASALSKGTTSSGWFRVTWEDVVNIDVHWVRSSLEWTWEPSSCNTGDSGWYNTWWRSGTGWNQEYAYAYLQNQCTFTDVWTNARFRNGTFCWPGTVTSQYMEVTVRGFNDGRLTGWVGDTWTAYPALCPHLNWHTSLGWY